MSSNGYDKEQIKRTYRLADIAARYGVKLTERGGKWTASCPFGTHADKHPSFAIFPGEQGYQLYKCLSCGAAGDVISFVEEMAGVDFQGAIHLLAGYVPAPKPEPEPEPPPPIIPARPYAGMKIMMPAPDNAPFKAGKRTPELFNPTSGKSPTYRPTGVYPYTTSDGRVVGYVLRVLIEKKKFCPAILWVRHPDKHTAWTHFHIPQPRLYHLHDLIRRPDDDVIITEGEKCADAAAELLPDMVSITWCGGTAQWQKANWTPVRDRVVILWPDNDAAGRACMLGSWHGTNGSLAWRSGLIETLHANGCTVEVVPEPRGRPEGWDIADALAEKFTSDSIAKYLKAQLEPWSEKSVAEYRERTRPGREPVAPVVQTVPQLHPVEQPLPDNIIPFRKPEPKPPREDWENDLERDDHGKPRKKSFQNYWVHIAHAPTLAGVFAWNSFSQNVYVKKLPPWGRKEDIYPRLLDKFDLPALRAHVERIYKLTPPSNEMVPSVLLAAQQNPFNPVLEYFDGLKWDGTPRILGGDKTLPWLTDYMGAEDTLINSAYGLRWLLSAVARAYEPGCKADCMLILEGKQNIGKSTAFRALAQIAGESYFTDSLRDFTSKDSKQLLSGKIIVEIAELSAYRNTRDVAEVKTWLSTQDDQYRPPYGTVPEIFYRTCVFAGTVNPGGAGYLNDPTGERRFWPVAVKRIDVDRLRRDREQLWAEAVVLHHEGVQHWLTDEEETVSETVTRKRQHRDAWHNDVTRHIGGRPNVSLPEIMGIDCLKLDKRDWTRVNAERVANILHLEGWQRTTDGDNREVYIPRIDS